MGAFNPIFQQIDPMKIGENSRAIRIARDYGFRLSNKSKSLKSRESMENLVSGYSDHGFVIDREEAEELFTDVAAPDSTLSDLFSALGRVSTHPIDDTSKGFVGFLNDQARSRGSTRKGKRNVTRQSRRQKRQDRTSANASGASTGTVGPEEASAGTNISPLRPPG